MNTNSKTGLPHTCARIDLGNGCNIEIREDSLGVVGARQIARANRTAVRTNQVCELARTLCESRATRLETRYAIARVDPSGLDDETVENLVARAAEMIPCDPERAYYILQLTYQIARQYASFWKQALVCNILGFFIVYHREYPEEALPVFRDLECLSHILGTYFGCNDMAQGLRQMAERGLAVASLVQNDSSSLEGPLPDQIWIILLDGSRAGDEGQWFMQSEAMARTCYALPQDIPVSVADALVELAKQHITEVLRQSHHNPITLVLRAITLADALATRGANIQAQELLLELRATLKSPSTLMSAILANRIATAQFVQARPDLAQETLKAMPYQHLMNLAPHSISAQGELVLHCLNQEEHCHWTGNSKGERHWAHECNKNLHSINAWDQIPSRTRTDDLRMLYGAIIHNIIHARLPDQRRLE